MNHAADKKVLTTDLLLKAVFLSTVFLLAFNRIHDTDAWMHLSIGKLIYNLRGLPRTEAFMYTGADTPFLYTSWLFAVISYIAYLLGGALGLVLLKSTVVTAAFWILLKTALVPRSGTLIAVIALTIAAIFSQYRFVLRPDIFLVLFLSLNIYFLDQFFYHDRKYLYALPAVNLLWGNIHSSITIMLVTFIAFLGGIVLHMMLKTQPTGAAHRPSARQLKIITIIGTASVLASLINPNGISQYLYSAEMLGHDWYKQMIAELQPTSGRHVIELAVVSAIALLSFAVHGRSASFPHLALLVPVTYLSISSERFRLLLVIVAAPMLVRNIAFAIDKYSLDQRLPRRWLVPAGIVAIVCMSSLAVAKVKPFGLPKNQLGSGFDYANMPRGALEYMDEHNIRGRVMNSMRFGQYIAWTSYPERTIFLDARAHLDDDLLEQATMFGKDAEVLNQLAATYGFTSILARYQDINSHTLPQKWALVYWDDVSLLYVLRSSEYRQVIMKDEYRFIRPDRPFSEIAAQLKNPGVADKVVAELQRNIRSTHSNLGYLILGLVHITRGDYPAAIQMLGNVRLNPTNPSYYFTARMGMADAYLSMGEAGRSLPLYQEAYRIKRDPIILYKLATLFSSRKDYQSARKYLDQAVGSDIELLQAYELLFSLDQTEGRPQNRQYLAKYERLKEDREFDEEFASAVRAYKSGDMTASIAILEGLMKGHSTRPELFVQLGDNYYNTGNLQTALTYYQKALELDPKTADAHYGLAVIYRLTNKPHAAVKHFSKQLELKPAGYNAREAKRALKELRSQPAG